MWWARGRGRDAQATDDGTGPGVTLAAVLVGLLVVGGAILATPNPCERESAYYCIRVVEAAPSRRAAR